MVGVDKSSTQDDYDEALEVDMDLDDMFVK